MYMYMTSIFREISHLVFFPTDSKPRLAIFRLRGSDQSNEVIPSESIAKTLPFTREDVFLQHLQKK